MSQRLQGKVALVTGGASGIGRGIARRFAAEGAAVVIADVNAAGAEEACVEIRRDGGEALAVTADVTQGADCERMVTEAVGRFGQLNVLVNNAGIGGGQALAEMDEEAWDRVLDVNLKGVFRVCKAAFPALVAAGGGSVVNIASLAAFVAPPGFGAYGASKAGVVQLTRVLATEGGRHQIRANALCPTWVWTPLVARHLAEAGDPVAVQAELASGIPLGRIATVEDVAAAALFFASDEAAFLTGVALPIDGGSSIKMR
jgi:NAD(P)-dependent dehydrogenase (short-subunit alcohol dehydrogenase family)